MRRRQARPSHCCSLVLLARVSMMPVAMLMLLMKILMTSEQVTLKHKELKIADEILLP